VDDSRLFLALQRGERRALDRVIERYTPYLSAVIWRTLGPNARREDTEEILSDVFLALWQHRTDLRPEENMKAYLAAIARNRATDRLRASRPASLPLEDCMETPGPGVEEAVLGRLEAAALLTAVESLPHPDRALVEGYYYEGRKLRELAKALGLSVPAAKSRLFRARATLKQLLTKGGSAYGQDG